MVPGPGAAAPSAGPAPIGGVTPADEVLLSPTETTAATVRSPSALDGAAGELRVGRRHEPDERLGDAELGGDGGEVLVRPLAVVLVVHVHVEDLARAAVPAAHHGRAEHPQRPLAGDAHGAPAGR